MREIEITINLDGSVEIDLDGFQGKGCSEITDEFVKALSGDVVKREQKKEYYKPKPKEKAIQRNG
jgi:hypothetical protein